MNGCTCTAHFAADPAEHDDDCAGLGMDYCGCCGNEVDGADANWCLRCVQHVGHFTSMHPWDRSYVALNDVDCPFQVPRAVTPKDDGCAECTPNGNRSCVENCRPAHRTATRDDEGTGR